MKKGKNNLSNCALDVITKRRYDRLKWLESCCQQVITVAETTLKKIQTDGLATNYSCNSDVQRWSERMHRASYELWLLSDISDLIEKGAPAIIPVTVQASEE
jgi:hypothetical protein